MTIITRSSFLCFLLLLVAARPSSGQSVPVQTGSPVFQSFHIPSTAGTLRYSVSGSERASIGADGENQTGYSSTVSGNLGFTTQSVLYPTSLIYSGGYISGNASQSSIFFQSLSASQSYIRKYSVFTVTDSLSYLPEAPSIGLSGLPGLGDLGANPNPTTTQGILSNTSQISNAAAAQYTRKLTGSTSLTGQGTYLIQRFLGGSDGLETNSYSVGGGVNHRINALSSYSVQYGFNNFSYVASPNSFNTQSATVAYNRTLTRKISISLGGGPEIIGASPVSGTSAMITYQINGSLVYTGRADHGVAANIAFARATNGGQGVSYGGETETLSSAISRRVGRSLGVSGTFGYAKTTSLQGALNPSIDATSYTASGQANRALIRNLSAYVSYSLQRQIYQGDAQSQAISPLNGTVQTVAVGITYSPQSLHLGRQ